MSSATEFITEIRDASNINAMKSLQIPQRMRENIELYFGDKGREWINDLPKLLAEKAREWSLSLEDPYENLSINFVTRASQGSVAAVLKMGVPNKEIKSEINALKYFNGNAAVRLLQYDIDKGALLLERILPGTPLRDIGNETEAMEIAASVIKRFQRPIDSQHEFITLKEWFRAMYELRSRFDRETGPIPQELFAQAESELEELLRTTEKSVLLHGDCHHDNIVLSEDRGWLVIDPKGIVGDPAFEVSAYVRNPSDRLSESDLRKLIPARIEQLSKLLALSPERIFAWGLLESILSVCWCIEENGSFEKPMALAMIYAELMGWDDR